MLAKVLVGGHHTAHDRQRDVVAFFWLCPCLDDLPHKCAAQNDANLTGRLRRNHVWDNVVANPLIGDPRLVTNKVSNGPTSAKCCDGLGVHEWNCRVQVGVLLTVGLFPSPAMVAVVL